MSAGIFARSLDGSLRLEWFAAETLETHPAVDATWTAHAAEAIARIAAGAPHKAPLAFSVPGHLTFVKSIRTAGVARSQRSRVVAFEAAQAMPLDEREMVWDYGLSHADSREFEAVLSGARTVVVEQLAQACADAGVAVTRAAPAWSALYQAFRHARTSGPEHGLLLGIGARSTQLIFLNGSKYYARSIAVGGNLVTQAIASELQCDFARAENLKLAVLTGAEAPRASELALLERGMETMVSRLHVEIVRTIDSLRRQGADMKPALVHVTGGPARDARFMALLGSRLQLPAQRFNPLARVEISQAARRAGAGVDAAGMAELVGLAAGESQRRDDRPCLLPPAAVREKRRRESTPVLVAAAALIGLALAFAVWRVETIGRVLAAEHAEFASRLPELRRHDAALAAAAAKRVQLEKESAALRRVVESRANWRDFLATLEERITRIEGVWLDEMRLQPASTSGGDVRGCRLRLGGRMLPGTEANQIAGARMKSLLSSLGELPQVTAVEAPQFEREESGVLRFSVVLQLDPETRPLNRIAEDAKHVAGGSSS